MTHGKADIRTSRAASSHLKILYRGRASGVAVTRYGRRVVGGVSHGVAGEGAGVQRGERVIGRQQEGEKH